VIALHRRVPVRRLAAGLGALLALAAVPVVVLPDVRTEVARRFWGVVDAFGLPIAHERPPPDLSLPVCGPPEEARQDGRPGSPCRNLEPEREIRVVFAQQGLALLGRRPVLGYGAGTFGGIVALEHDERWHRHPRWGPEGFDMLGFHGKTVDSFWLHLVVELGLVGLACYLGWLALLARRVRPDPWAGSVIAFAVVIAVFAPALEGPLFPPLMFAILGFSMLKGQDEFS
ncbi:O-antigen ligase family protein, partial [Allorhizocola rhizosphaerae]|uniref:O-antigen ligase family protein n=1 Tax=Allorhizocola rhizosphaerae TaxID=1872709 RepID=UPI001B8BDEDA